MASPEIINILELVTPISDEKKTGSDIRDDVSPDSLYYKIKDARNTARAHERKNLFDFSQEANEAWRDVLDIAPQILKNHSKDLEIVSWYLEALLRIKSFRGLRDGILLLDQLITGFWGELYPLPDEDGIETTVASLSGLNGQGSEGVLIAPMRRALITQGEEPGPFSFWQYQQALDIQKIVEDSERKKKAESLGFSIKDIENAVKQSAQDFYIDLRDDLEACVETYKGIGKKLDEYCGAQEAPGISNIVNTLQQCLGAVKHLAKDILSVNQSLEDISDESHDEEHDRSTSNISSAPQLVQGPIKNRAHAFEQLNTIAEYFLETEPHSPISYTLQKVIHWGDMSLTELISELIPDSSSRQHYESLTGVKCED